jgi:transposase-like protein
MIPSVKRNRSNVRDYTEEAKWKAVQTVEKKGFKVASDTTGVGVTTLQKWKRQYGGVAKPAKKVVEDVVESKEPVVYDEGFAGEVMKTKDIVLTRMQKIIPTEEDLGKLTQALKLLNDINTQGHDKESTPVVRSWYQQINLTIEKLNQINTNGHKDGSN